MDAIGPHAEDGNIGTVHREERRPLPAGRHGIALPPGMGQHAIARQASDDMVDRIRARIDADDARRQCDAVIGHLEDIAIAS